MKCTGLLLFIAVGSVLLVIFSFKPTPDSYVLISTSVAAVSNKISQANVTESFLPNKFLKQTIVVRESSNAVPYANSKVTFTEPSRNKISVDVTDYVKTPVRGERNIFFIESSCAVNDSKNAVFIKPRQACAVESAALTNPNATIYYLDTCLGVQGLSESRTTNKTLVREVFRYPNVKTFHVELSTYLNNTPLSEWINNNRLKHSKYPVEHSSDVLRLVTLWKFGGRYLDLDFIVLRQLTDLDRDFVVAESDELIANGALSFSADGVGHDVVDACLKDLLSHFDGQEWGYNGPHLITRVLSKLCNGASIPDMTREKCKGFTVYRPSVFFPFYYPSWRRLFDESDAESTMELVLKNGTYGVHAWNKMSHAEPIKVGSKQAYAQLASRFCPRVYSAVGETF